MFIAILFNTEYMDYESRMKWYLKNLLFCKDNNGVLITHEYLNMHFQELQDRVDERFLSEFDIQYFSPEDLSDVEQYFIPDELFSKIEKEKGSRTHMLTSLLTESCLELEEELRTIFDKIISKSSVPVHYVFHCLEPYEFTRKVCREYNLQLNSYVFSCIRKVHGYRETLYSVNSEDRLYDSTECEKRYNNFLKEEADLPLLSNRDLIGLFGKERTLPLIKLLNYQSTHELCICGEAFSIVPCVFNYTHYTDDDIHYECNQLYRKDQIRTRQHPYMLDQMHIDRSEMQNDPAAFILSCKRITAVCSQIILKGMLWNRTVIMKKNTLPFSFMCEKDYSSENKIDLTFLNYYIFCYLVPTELMFNMEYWEWRQTRPQESEIYRKHLSFYCRKFSISADLFSADKDERFKNILTSRNCSDELINQLLTEDILEVDYDAATSLFRVGKKEYWVLNRKREDGVICSEIEFANGIDSITFYPLVDKAAFVKIENIIFNWNPSIIDKAKLSSNFFYCAKGKGINLISECLGSEIKSGKIEILWKYNSIKEQLSGESRK